MDERFNFSNMRKTGDLIQRLPDAEHTARAVEARRWALDNDPANVRMKE